MAKVLLLLSVRKRIFLSVGIFFFHFIFIFLMFVCMAYKKSNAKEWNEWRREQLIQTFSHRKDGEKFPNDVLVVVQSCISTMRTCFNKQSETSQVAACHFSGCCFCCCCCRLLTFLAAPPLLTVRLYGSEQAHEWKQTNACACMVSTLVAKSKEILRPIFEMELVKWRKEKREEKMGGKNPAKMQKRVSLQVLSFIRFSEDVLA